jgi:alpha-L-rhamnosidase
VEGDTTRRSASPYLRKEFAAPKKIASARLYVTSNGFYEITINGKRAGDHLLTPGWTSFKKRLQYQVYDITGLVAAGKNAIGAILGDGWYRWPLDSDSTYIVNRKQTGLLAQVHIQYSDGTTDTIITDGSWKCTRNGPIRMSDIYNGETFDARKEMKSWDKPGFEVTNWGSVKLLPYDLNNLVASDGVPVRKKGEIVPVRLLKAPSGKLVADMGQNMVGWVRLKVSGPSGTRITLRHAEVMDRNGEIYTENLRKARCEVNYTLSGKGIEIFEPRFTFMGFRYVEVSGFTGDLTIDNVTGIVIHSDMDVTGSFECSNPLINQLQHNILWGQKGNFVDVPTDCPQRDERLGWTGDAQVFCRTAAFNMDVSAFFTKWLKDLAADQRRTGEVPIVIPNIVDREESPEAICSAGWGDVAVIAPWTMYMIYGDKRLLKEQYPSMKGWVEYIRTKAGNDYLWEGGSLYGDWLFYHPPVNAHREADGFTDHDFIATAFFAYSVNILALAAHELGMPEDGKLYSVSF